jgi:hypothetical protein
MLLWPSSTFHTWQQQMQAVATNSQTQLASSHNIYC